MGYFLLGAALLGLDQWVKYYTVTHLALGEAQPLLEGFVELCRVHNYGAAWSSFSGLRWPLAFVSFAIVAAVAWLLAKKLVRHPLGRTAGMLLVVGGLGNLLDRLRLGYVVDMFNFQFIRYPVFNVADMCIVAGAVLGAAYYLRFYDKYDRKGAGDGTADSGSGA